MLVLGGARSGKSAFAQRLATECGEPVLYVATAAATDEEMAARIARHRADRPAQWRTLEARGDLGADVARALGDARTVLVEDLTLALSTCFEQSPPEVAEQSVIDDITALLGLEVHVLLVTNEVGMGVVPAYVLGRAFRDALGRVNQHAAALVPEAYLIVAGLPLRLK